MTTKQHILKRIEERWLSIYAVDWDEMLLPFESNYKKSIDEAILESLKQINIDNNTSDLRHTNY